MILKANHKAELRQIIHTDPEDISGLQNNRTLVAIVAKPLLLKQGFNTLHQWIYIKNYNLIPLIAKFIYKPAPFVTG